jgi:hypothetical protein
MSDLDSSLPVLTSTHLHTVLTPAELRARVREGSLVRLHRGAYVQGDEWQSLDRDARYRALIRAAATSHADERVFSHQSAAALWGLPSLGPWDASIHLLVPRATGGRSDPGVRRHALGVPDGDVVSREGLLVTTLPRTLVDIATTASVMWAVAAIDAALHVPQFGGEALIARELILEQWERMRPFRGHARARRILEFCAIGSGSTSESASRVGIALLGFPAPELQPHFRVSGRDYWCDFGWKGGRVIGECDGDSKYLDPALRQGRSADEVVLAEKRREDAIRAQVDAFQRWGSAEALSPRLLRQKLLALGLTPGRPRLRGR